MKSYWQYIYYRYALSIPAFLLIVSLFTLNLKVISHLSLFFVFMSIGVVVIWAKLYAEKRVDMVKSKFNGDYIIDDKDVVQYFIDRVVSIYIMIIGVILWVYCLLFIDDPWRENFALFYMNTLTYIIIGILAMYSKWKKYKTYYSNIDK